MAELTIKTTKSERREWCWAMSYSFEIVDGIVCISEKWGGLDELYSDGVAIKMPARIWKKAYPWIIENMRPT